MRFKNAGVTEDVGQTAPGEELPLTAWMKDAGADAGLQCNLEDHPPLTLLASRTFRSSSWLCWVISTVSAEVTQPLHARQSSNEILAFSSFRVPPSWKQENLVSKGFLCMRTQSSQDYRNYRKPLFSSSEHWHSTWWLTLCTTVFKLFIAALPDT